MDARKLAAARLWATAPHRFPYLASALFALPVQEVPGLGGVQVDERWRLYVDPDVTHRWTVEELGSLLVHHVGHLVRDHSGRAHSLGITGAAQARWARAADAEINDDLADAGLKVPGTSVLPEDLGCERNRLAEEYFHAESKIEAESESESEAKGEGESEPKSEPPAPECGSGAHGQRGPHEPPDDPERDGSDEGGPRPRPPDGGLSQHEGDLVRAQVAGALREAARAGIGVVPAAWQRWASDLLEPRVDWRRALGAEIRRSIQSVTGAVDYSYRRPSRRASVSRNVVLPALHRPVPEVAVVCDTSGSMDDDDMGRILVEVEGILQGAGLRRTGITVLSVDAEVHAVSRISRAAQAALVGGGGTDMAKGIAAALDLRPRASIVVVLTDGQTTWPTEAPRNVRVVIGLIGAGPREARAAPAWARVVHIDGA